MNENDVISFAQSQGWDGAKKIPRPFLGCEVWEGTLKDVDPENPPEIGLPLVLLVKEDSIRCATADETLVWMSPQSDSQGFADAS